MLFRSDERRFLHSPSYVALVRGEAEGARFARLAVDVLSRPTVGTMTSIADYPRALWGRSAALHSEVCEQPVVRDSSPSMSP